MGGGTEVGVNAKSFSGQVMLMRQLWAFPLIQMLCKELAQGPKLMHLYSLQPRAWTNEWLGSFKQSSLSFFSQGKCAHKKAAFQLIKPVCSYTPSPLFFLPLSPAQHALREIKQLRTEYKFTLPPFMSFTPLIVWVKEMSSPFLVKVWFWCIRWVWFCTLTQCSLRRWLTAENVQKTIGKEGYKIRVGEDRTKITKLFIICIIYII